MAASAGAKAVVKGIVSASAGDAKLRVLGLYRAWYRQVRPLSMSFFPLFFSFFLFFFFFPSLSLSFLSLSSSRSLLVALVSSLAFSLFCSWPHHSCTCLASARFVSRSFRLSQIPSTPCPALSGSVFSAFIVCASPLLHEYSSISFMLSVHLVLPLSCFTSNKIQTELRSEQSKKKERRK